MYFKPCRNRDIAIIKSRHYQSLPFHKERLSRKIEFVEKLKAMWKRHKREIIWTSLSKALQMLIEKKLTNLTKNNNNRFMHNDIITNLSSYDLTTEELNLKQYIFKQGFQHSIPPNYLNKTDIFASFELIHRFFESGSQEQRRSQS